MPAWLDRWFGTPPPPSDPPDGLPRLPGVKEPETLYLLLAIILAIGVAGLLEWVISAAPVPPGGDPGQWISSSFPYIGRPYPSQVIFFGYPPLLFPLLGLFVVIGGSPIVAGQLFIAVGTVLLGLSTYAFARAMLHRPLLALFVEGFVLLDAPFMRLFFFGGYPTVLAIVFMQLAFAFGSRWMGSYRPGYLFLTWILLTATVLTHSLVGLLAVGAFGFSVLVLFFQRTLPREVLFSKAGVAGLFVFIFGVGGYYVGTRLFGIQHPNYLSSNPLGRTKTNLNALLYPFHLNSLPGLFGHIGHFSSSASYGLAIAFCVILFFAIAYLASRRRLSVPALLQGSFILAVIAVGVVGWTLSIVTDYRRFAYFLYIPITLAVAYIFDYLLGIFLAAGSGDEEAPGLPPLPKRKPRTGPDPISVAILVVGVVGLVFIGYTADLPELQFFERQFTGAPHSQYYLDAVGTINHDGLSGSILTDNTAADRWTRALTDRNTYDSAEPTDFVFYGSQILDDEETQFAFHNLYGVSDGLTYASVTSLNASRIDAVPWYTVWSEGIPSKVLGVVPSSLSVTLGNGSIVKALSGKTGPQFAFQHPGVAEMSLSFQTPDYNLTELIAPHPGEDGFDLSFIVTAVGTHTLQSFSGYLGAIAGDSASHNATNATSYNFTSRGPSGAGALATHVLFEQGSGSTNASVIPSRPTAGVAFVETEPKGQSRQLKLTISLTTPTASNLIPNVPPILSTPDLLLGWSARYMLLDSASAPLIAYYTTEFHAVELTSNPYWSVYTLPVTYPPTPYGPP
jgi:hypothetical protein